MNRILLVIMTLIIISCNEVSRENKSSEEHADPALVRNGIHVLTGLKAEEGYKLIWANCTPCHSAKLITQNRATREGWDSMIDWMQKTQNLWNLGENREKILDYLAKNYPPEEKGRRENLANIEWYILDED